MKDFVVDYLGLFLTFDSRSLRTIVPVFTKPGFLTNQYLAGRRVSYLAPSRLYCIISVFFFFLEQRYDQVKIYQFQNRAILGSLLQARNMSMESLATIFQAKYNGLLPTFLVGVVPIFAGVIALLYIRKNRNLVQHMIFSFHFYSFALIVFILTFVHVDWVQDIAFLAVFLHLIFALKKVYKQSWLLSASKAIALFLAFIVILATYFEIVFRFTLRSI